MGQFLSEPDDEVHEEAKKGNGLTAHLAYMQGWRKTQEDAHTVTMTIEALPGCSFFAVFDGHGGPQVSKYCSTFMLANFLASPSIKGNKTPSADQIKSGLMTAFKITDANLRTDCEKDPSNLFEFVGTTATCALITKTDIFLANAGDSRTVLCDGNVVKFATADHKPANTEEHDRIKACKGGFVANGRVMGNLAVSRALGDFNYKFSYADKEDTILLPPEAQMVSPIPDITQIKRPDSFTLILACDGIWDVMTNEACARYIWEGHGKDKTPTQSLTLNNLLKDCLKKQSKDNMSVIIVETGASKEDA